MLNIRRSATPLLLSLLAVTLLAAPAQAAKPWVKLDWGTAISGGKNTTLQFGITNGGKLYPSKMRVCWESSSWCVKGIPTVTMGSPQMGSGWKATFSSPTKTGAFRKLVVYYNIGSYVYKHVLRLMAGDPGVVISD